jgi:hypothetical protein
MIIRMLVSLIVLILLATDCQGFLTRFQSRKFLSSSAAYKRNDKNQESEVDETIPFKTGSHTYASWKQSNDPLVDEVDDFEVDERIIEREPSNVLLEWIKKIYDAIFFYGLETPRSPKKQLEYKPKKKRKSMFFTPGEQFSAAIISDPRLTSDIKNNNSEYPFTELELEEEIFRNEDELDSISVSLELKKENADYEFDPAYVNLIRRQEKLYQDNENLQVLLVKRLSSGN